MANEQRPSTTDRIFLVGFMGAGKTTVGKLLARRLGWSFVDLDDRIRTREAREIADIFAQSGEGYFRQVESACLRELLGEANTFAPGRGDAGPRSPRSTGVVVALGGGAFARAENAAMLRQTGAPVVFLDAGVEELRRRCAAAGEERPLFRDENHFRQLYEARRSAYMAADVRVDTAGKTPQQVGEELACRLQASGFRLQA